MCRQDTHTNKNKHNYICKLLWLCACILSHTNCVSDLHNKIIYSPTVTAVLRKLILCCDSLMISVRWIIEIYSLTSKKWQQISCILSGYLVSIYVLKLIKNVASTDNTSSSQRSEFICFSVSSLLLTFAWGWKTEDAVCVLLACLSVYMPEVQKALVTPYCLIVECFLGFHGLQ